MPVPEPESPDWDNLQEKIRLISAQVPDGESFLNCLFNRFRGRLNRWSLEELAFVINLQGGVGVIDKAVRARIAETYKLKDPADLAKTAELARCTGKDLPDVDQRRAEIRRKRQSLAADAAFECASAQMMGDVHAL
ncbi:MAG: hypothetical protein ACOYOH_11895 [Paracraurococcus sp.]